MIAVTFKYTDYGHKETQEFREYAKNLVGYRESGEYQIRFGKESDPMFDDKVVCQIELIDEDYAFDVVNHFMMDREVNGESVPFDVDLPSVALYVTGSDRIMNYLTSRSISHLYERVEIAENRMDQMNDLLMQLKGSHEKMSAHIQLMGVDKFPDIVRQLTESMKFEGHDCKAEINNILKRKVH